jgi:hypothetical protein
MAAEIAAELDSAVVRAPAVAEPRAGLAQKAALLAIVALQLAWSSALVVVLAAVIR